MPSVAGNIASLLIILLLCEYCKSVSLSSCNRTRIILFEPWGVITDGPENYSQESHCEWLIKAPPHKYITLNITSLKTECSYDHLFVYGSDSYNSDLIGVFSGENDPVPVISNSGFMLILLYSDTNYVLSGFEAIYSITDCPLNCSFHGNCNTGKCECDEFYTGTSCELELCPNKCGILDNKGYCISADSFLSAYCLCNPNFSGDGCDLGSVAYAVEGWHWLSRGCSIFTPRTSHGSVYFPHLDRFYVFGGYNLNKVLGDHLFYDFSYSTWVDLDNPESKEQFERKKVFSENSTISYYNSRNRSLIDQLFSSDIENHTINLHSKHLPRYRGMRQPDDKEEVFNKQTNFFPLPRYGHVMQKYGNDFVIFGGKLITGEVSSELWLYITSSNTWQLLAQNSDESLPGLMFSTLTVLDDSWLYLFGGSLASGEFSNIMYRINLNENGIWEKVISYNGDYLDARLVGHSVVFYPPLRSLFVYGGIRVDIARFSKLSDRMLVFNVDEHFWAEINYPRGNRDSLEMHIPLERAFHTAVIVGNYMVVFGGYMHKHKEEETCYDYRIYLYHFGCNVWSSHSLTSLQDKDKFLKPQGVYGHTAFIRNGNTLVIVGGFHGTVTNHVIANILPSTIAVPKGNVLDLDSVCNQHKTTGSCVSNLECAWCPSDNTCYARKKNAYCNTNLQTLPCPGLCPSLKSCLACVILGRGTCSWCVEEGICHSQKNGQGHMLCGTPSTNSIGQEGWWGSVGHDIISPEECYFQDLQPGLTFMQYRYPPDLLLPDKVEIVNSSVIEIKDKQEFTGAKVLQEGGTILSRLMGYIHPKWPNNKQELDIFLRAAHVNATVYLSKNDKISGLEKVAVIFNTSRGSAHRPDGTTMFPDLSQGKKYLIRVDGIQPVRPSYSHPAHIIIEWNGYSNNRQQISNLHLEPYSRGGKLCGFLKSCLACLTDAKCGWCPVTRRCMPRDEFSGQCIDNITQIEYFLVLNPSSCQNCEQHIYCESCVETEECEWLADDAHCTRKGRFDVAVKSLEQCPISCHTRATCMSCLGEPGRCAWCEETKECFLFSVYTSKYQYGLCRVWLDEDHTNITVLQLRNNDYNEECHICEDISSCSVCLQSLGCGWCYNEFNPTVGLCSTGDFSGPNRGSCESLISPLFEVSLVNDSIVSDGSNNNSKWAYAECPDVDECSLKLHSCHPNATCSNLPGSYTCTCNRGFKGNGKSVCDRTCFESCVYGYCTGFPKYECHCEIGWTGRDCGTNCGCNNHSTCKNGTGFCDNCQDCTMGEYCELCKAGSYGNATTSVGCQMCECNGHGDASLGMCNSTTGDCYCLDNTEGRNCQKCIPGYYGDPTNGGKCYRECSARNFIYNAHKGFLGAQTTDLDVPANCIWIITPYATLEKSHLEILKSSIIEFTVFDLNIDCQHRYLYIYDGLPDVISRDMHWDRQNHVLGTLCADYSKLPAVFTASSGYMVIYYEKSYLNEGFNASYEVFTCTQSENPGHRRHCINYKPVCKDGWRGNTCNIEVCPNDCFSLEHKGFCDYGYGRCICYKNYTGSDCSTLHEEHQVLIEELFDPQKISPSLLHLQTLLPRMGHSLIADNRGSLWLFGGYSLSRGPLNDVQQFDTRNLTWVQVTVNIEAGWPPSHRFFQAATYAAIEKMMYVYGGLNTAGFLCDFWKFNLALKSWTQVHKDCVLPPLAGHTLTYINKGNVFSLIVIGGISSSYGFLEKVWEYDLIEGSWKTLNTSGTSPVGIFGHSTVYHEQMQAFYVYGGYSFKVDRVDHFPDLYALNYPNKRWSLLPPDRKINHNPASLPMPRLFHSAVTADEYMVIIGGYIVDHRSARQDLLVYSYKCNMWIPLNNQFISLAGPEFESLVGTSAVSLDTSIYVFGGYSSFLHGSVIKIKIPEDLCTLNINKTQCRDRIGCANCVIYESTGTNTSYCYSNTKPEPNSCLSPKGGRKSVTGVRCDYKLFEDRDCYQYKTCSECLAWWPVHRDLTQKCKWCSNCAKGKCVPLNNDCSKENNCVDSAKNATKINLSIVKSDECQDRLCVASDCDKCLSLGGCLWTRQLLRSAEKDYTFDISPARSWNCVVKNIQVHTSFSSYLIEVSPPNTCPVSCHHHKTCKACLTSHGAEGGWQQCYWSSILQECLSPGYAFLRCIGGSCGQLLSGGVDHCPKSCYEHNQCSHCLSQPHCGWCALGTGLGSGMCTEGHLEGPYIGSCVDLGYSKLFTNHTNCDGNTEICKEFSDFLMKTSNVPHRLRHINRLLSENDHSRAFLSWHYDVCPPENECKNGHHECNPKSEYCVDQLNGYKCVCSVGYNMTENVCLPVCSQGCVFGDCIEPDNCSCHFGVVGNNCSIKCLCNGHSNCVGPDKLNKCLECKNNTIGAQCDKCKPFFVGDPTNGGVCISCKEYCNTHTSHCFSSDLFNFTDITLLIDIEAVQYITEGAKGDAVCYGCQNYTTGITCDSCHPGYFRGSSDKRKPCIPCQCNGHGTSCDPTYGDNCNCANNTETSCNTKAGLGRSEETEDNKKCWQKQCTKCKKDYIGMPSNGHQCYLALTFEDKSCFNPSSEGSCENTPSLPHGQTLFFAVQPKYMNVDIRLVLDIMKGNADIYFSSVENSFIVSLNETSWYHEVALDSNFPLSDQEEPRHYRKPLVDSYYGFELFDMGAYKHFPITTTEKPAQPIYTNSSSAYYLLDKNVKGSKAFITLHSANEFLIVRNITSRLVVILPQQYLELKFTKFYIIVHSNSDDNSGVIGSVFFRQDQIRIDLFVFFSVFFSCFFLFLAICVVIWKVKQGVDLRRARQRHVVELLHMARRPFASTKVIIQPEDDAFGFDPLEASLEQSPWSPGRRKRFSKKDKSPDVFDIAPIAIEPTDDGVAAVITAVVQLPGVMGGESAPECLAPTHRIALASSLCLMSRIYPSASRPFNLRRRASHLAAQC